MPEKQVGQLVGSIGSIGAAASAMVLSLGWVGGTWTCSFVAPPPRRWGRDGGDAAQYAGSIASSYGGSIGWKPERHVGQLVGSIGSSIACVWFAAMTSS